MPTWTQPCLTRYQILLILVRFHPHIQLHSPYYVLPDITSSITYSSSASIIDSGPVVAYLDINDTLLVPYQQIAAPASTRTITLVAAFNTMNDGTNHATFNDVTYNSPLTPAILSEMSLSQNATYAPAYGPTSFVLNYMDVIDIDIQNSDTGKHPLYVRPFSSYFRH